MRDARRAAFLAACAVAAVACGISVVGLDANPSGVEAGIDASTVDVFDAADSADADAGPPCDAGGRFCDYCDSTLVLCIEFDGGIHDESSYAREIDFDGGGEPGFVFEGGAGALPLDGSFQMTFASGPKLHANELFTIEVWAKLRSLPRDAGRFGLFDRESIAGMFIYGADGGGGQPRLRCAGNDVVVKFETDRYMHFACTANATNQRVRVYVDGVPVVDGDSGVSVPPDAGWDRHFVLMGNDPSGDDFQGEVASIRMYTSIRTANEIARAAGVDAGP